VTWGTVTSQPLLQKNNWILWVCVCTLALVILYANCTFYGNIMFSFVACLAIPYFSTLSHKMYNSWTTFPEHKEGFDFFYDFCLNISHSENNSTRYYHKSTQVFVWSTCYSCQILIKLEFSGHTFEKSSSTKFHEGMSSGSHADPRGQKHGQDKTNRHFSQFCLIKLIRNCISRQRQSVN